MIDKLIYYFQFPFVTYALIAGVLTALCSSLFGVTLVLRRFSFIVPRRIFRRCDRGYTGRVQ